MGAPQDLPSFLGCELRIRRAKNIELKPNTQLFVRCYLSAGNDKRIRLDSKVISSKSDLLFFNHSFSLECLASQEATQALIRHGTVVFELRRRSATPFLGNICGSHLLGRAEVPWKTVSEASEMEIEEWVSLVSDRRRVHHQDVKPPALQVSIKVKLPVVSPGSRGRRRLAKWDNDHDECGCKDVGCNCADYDVFALAAAMEAF
ncbi:uncharacterized protein LOC127800287 [Diospyros lotus]|uniref:uncharacterized protein LOC127800287 n=1 Tax=Diospyros lotus TaxID=55363 RepID=UPI002258AB1A|nr:uncharacterized protein LOC127800287 [Diospyros lotus]